MGMQCLWKVWHQRQVHQYLHPITLGTYEGGLFQGVHREAGVLVDMHTRWYLQ